MAAFLTYGGEVAFAQNNSVGFQYAHEADPDSWRNDWPMAGRNYYIYFGGLWGGQLNVTGIIRRWNLPFCRKVQKKPCPHV